MIQQTVYYNIVRYILINYNTSALLSRALRIKCAVLQHIIAYSTVEYITIHLTVYRTISILQHNRIQLYRFSN